MNPRDDVVIRPLLRTANEGATPAQQRRAESELTERAARRAAAKAPRRPIRKAGIAARIGGGAVIVAAALVALRLATGRSFEGMGTDMRDAMFGSLDERAAGEKFARGELRDDEVARLVANRGTTDGSPRRIFDVLAEQEARRVRGSQLIDADRGMQVNNAADIVILRGATFIQEMRNAGVPEEVAKFRQAMQQRAKAAEQAGARGR